MTEFHQSERMQETLLAMKRFCRSLIHDLNNPLSALSGYLQLMELRLDALRGGDLSVGEALCDFHRKIQDSLTRIVGIVQRLDQFSKVKPSSVRPVNLNQLWSELIAKRSCEEQKRVKLHCEDESLSMHAMAACLEQIGRELLDNALIATRDGGEVKVSILCSSEQNRVIMEVSDSGHGMDAKLLEEVFLPCHASREEGAFPKQGLIPGMGLPIAYQLTAELGGKMEIWSEAAGGTRVRLEFPR